jgi:molybdate-binding protein
MKKIEAVHSFGNIKLLADSRRMGILRLLMASPATLTQLARTLKRSPAWIRHYVLALESADLVEVGEIRKTGKVTEKFYRARADALLLQEIILPRTKKPAVIFSGSHDLALEGIAEALSQHVILLSLPVGSLDGLVNLRQGLCQISGSHLLDETGEYNTPFVRRLFPDRLVEIVTLAYRTQGLMLSSGNPKGVRKIADIAKPNIRFVNRNPGSGTRLWFDTELRKLNIPMEKINGYDKVYFIPLFEERYDLVLPRENEKTLTPLLDYLQTTAFRTELSVLTGYNSAHSGEQVPL